MFDAQRLQTAYSNLLGWKQHDDTNDFQISTPLTVSETGEYYQSKHPAMALDIIKAQIKESKDISAYLTEKVSDSVVEMFNDVIQKRQLNKNGKTLLDSAILLNKQGWLNDLIVNQNRFVGFQIRLKAATGLKMKINEIGFQFRSAEDFTLYLFHTSKAEPIDTFQVTTSGGSGWKWQVENVILHSMKTAEFQGGAFVLGYYQEDLTDMAINYSNFDFNKGECGTCNSRYRGVWEAVNRYYHIFPIYVPEGSFEKGEMFDTSKAFFIPNQSFGLNLKLTTECDLTQFFIDNRFMFKNLLSLKVVHKILYDMKFSTQTNYIEEDLKMMIIRDLEGDKETNYLNISQQYDREMKAVKFNTGGINSLCLDCEDSPFVPQIGAM